MLKKLIYKASGNAIQIFSGHRQKQALSVLIYHQVLPQRDYLKPTEITLKEFEWQMKLLSTHFVPLGLKEALDLLERHQLPKKAVCVTFDDGYADNHDVAAPVLTRCKVPATFFIATGFLNGGRMWNDTIIESVRALKGQSLDLSSKGLDQYPLQTEHQQLQSLGELLNRVKYLSTDRRVEVTKYLETQVPDLPDNLMMSDKQIKNLRQAGFEIGGHTVNHPILMNLDAEQAREEILKGKAYLESLLGESINFFAYPNGQWGKDFDQSHVDLVKEIGFKSAVTTNWGRHTYSANPYLIPRFTPWDKSPLKFYLRLLRKPPAV